MALTFGALISDEVDHGSDASIDDLDPCTYMTWCYPTTFTDARRLMAKRSIARTLALSGTGGDLDLLVRRVTTDTRFITNDTPLTLNAWNFVAWTLDTGAAAGQVGNIYVGDLSTEAVESSYSTSTDGSGAFGPVDAPSGLIVGNRDNNTEAFQGRIAIACYHNAFLSLAQVRSWQFKPRVIDANTVLYCHYGFNGTGTQPDWSGRGNSGTVTGATVADHVPLGPPFAFDREWQGEIVVAAAGTILPQVIQQGLYAGSAA